MKLCSKIGGQTLEKVYKLAWHGHVNNIVSNYTNFDRQTGDTGSFIQLKLG